MDVLVESSIISELMNPKILKRAKRVQNYRSFQPNSSSSNSTVYVDLPAENFADLTQCYLEFDVATTNQIAQVNEILRYETQIASGPTNMSSSSDIGTFIIYFGEYSVGPYNFKTVSSTVIANDIDQLPIIIQNGLVGLVGVALALVPGSILIINSGNFKFAANGQIPDIMYCFSSATSATSWYQLFPSITAAGSIASPILEYGAGSFIDEVTIVVNSNEIIKVPNYYLLNQIYCSVQNVDYRRTSGRLYMGENERESRYLAPGQQRRFIVPLYGIGLFDHILPLGLVPGITFRIQIRFASAAIALATATNIQDYTVSNIRFQYHTINYDSSIVQKVKKAIDNDGLLIGFSQFFSYPFSLSGDGIIPINISVKRFQGVLAVMRQNDFITNTLSYERNANFISNSIKSARLQIGSTYYPSDRLNSINNNDFSEFYVELERSFEMFKPYERSGLIWTNSAVAGLNYEAARHTAMQYERSGRRDLPSFIMAIFVDPYLEENFRHTHTSGIDTSGLNTINLELTGLQLASQNTLNVFTQFVGFLILKGNGVIYDR